MTTLSLVEKSYQLTDVELNKNALMSESSGDSTAVVTGDFNGDGASDVIVGAIEDGSNTDGRTGAAFVFLSSGGLPSITFSDTTSSQSENTTQVTIPVTLSKTSSSTVTIDYTVTSTATGGGVDFTLTMWNTIIQCWNNIAKYQFYFLLL